MGAESKLSVKILINGLIFARSSLDCHILAQAACVRHACLRAPCVAWPLLSPSFSLSFSLLAQAACVRHASLRAPCVAWPLLLPLFSLFPSFYFFLLILQFLAQAALRAPPEVGFAMRSWPLL